MNIAIGGNFGGSIDNNIFNNPVEMVLDYVRVYELVTGIESNSILNLEVFPNPTVSHLSINTASFTSVNIISFIGKRTLLDHQIIESITTVNIPRNIIPGLYVLEIGLPSTIEKRLIKIENQ